MMTEIQNISFDVPDLIEVYGFGSYFRSANANDCDILLVVRNNSSDLGRLHFDLSQCFYQLGEKLSVRFDLTILTEQENARKPLLEHDILVPLYTKK